MFIVLSKPFLCIGNSRTLETSSSMLLVMLITQTAVMAEFIQVTIQVFLELPYLSSLLTYLAVNITSLSNRLSPLLPLPFSVFLRVLFSGLYSSSSTCFLQVTLSFIMTSTSIAMKAKPSCSVLKTTFFVSQLHIGLH